MGMSDDKQTLKKLGIANWEDILGSNVFKGNELLGTIGGIFYEKFWVRSVEEFSETTYSFKKTDIEKIENRQVYINQEAQPDVSE